MDKHANILLTENTRFMLTYMQPSGEPEDLITHSTNIYKSIRGHFPPSHTQSQNLLVLLAISKCSPSKITFLEDNRITILICTWINIATFMTLQSLWSSRLYVASTTLAPVWLQCYWSVTYYPLSSFILWHLSTFESNWNAPFSYFLVFWLAQQVTSSGLLLPVWWGRILAEYGGGAWVLSWRDWGE